MNLNGRSLGLVESLLARAEERKVAAHPIERGGRFVDCGIEARGGLRTGLELARICLADLAEVTLVPGDVAGRSCPLVQVVTDHPAGACLASQYAGWQIQEGKFFAMGSGPMRAAWGHEAIFEKIGHRETVPAVVGVLEGRKTPTPAVVAKIASSCRRPALGRDAPGRADGQPGGRRPGGRPIGRDGLAQALGAGLRPLPGRGRRTGPPRCRRSPPTTWPRSAGPTTRSSMAPASSSSSPATTPA